MRVIISRIRPLGTIKRRREETIEAHVTFAPRAQRATAATPPEGGAANSGRVERQRIKQREASVFGTVRE